ncbi:MAG: type VI secretion system protein TssA [Paracraurococcus sp.]
MSAATDPDLAVLLQPLPRAGIADPLLVEQIEARIREARRAEDPRTPQGVWQRDRKRADWAEVRRLCSDWLGRHAKDLRMAAWLAEAWARLDGFDGLLRGLRLIDGLCAAHWPGLQPPVEDGDLEARLLPLEWLNERMPQLLRQLPLLRAPEEPELAVSWADYLNAQRLETVRERDAKAFERTVAGGALPLSRIATVRDRAPLRELTATADALRGTVAVIDGLSDRLAVLCGRQAPSLARLRSAAEEILVFIGTELDRRRLPDAMPPAAGSVPPPPPAAERQPVAPPAGPAPPPASREEAYRRLAEVAALLHRIEPHSPVPYLLDRAIAWGDLSLPELLAQIDVGGQGMAALFALLDLPEAVWLGLEDGEATVSN